MDAITKIKTAKGNKAKKNVNECEVVLKSESINNESSIIIENMKKHNQDACNERIEGSKSNLENSTECNFNTNNENDGQLDGTNQMQNDEDIRCTATETDIDAKVKEELNRSNKHQTVELKIITTTILPALHDTNFS